MKSKNEIVGVVDQIANGYVHVDGCVQFLRYGWDTIHDVKVGDKVRCVFGNTTYGAGYKLIQVLERPA